ncbi:conserved hypothetical protein [Desulforapulum autotrophicum HRM2]|uniref:Macro domain-containing protein n=1 Tax=Desulforapulum autotrophicum (strain ATCC 43914 / DSM 3382 / VKM B-1955 / HRM2) TaxID=177437 RepID=C0QGD4_DESAH|nr:conserved hypothetical protein [Desulforapulum autotrophicum HRM2]
MFQKPWACLKPPQPLDVLLQDWRLAYFLLRCWAEPLKSAKCLSRSLVQLSGQWIAGRGDCPSSGFKVGATPCLFLALIIVSASKKFIREGKPRKYNDMDTIKLVQGDITLAAVDVIVNAANFQMLGNGG